MPHRRGILLLALWAVAIGGVRAEEPERLRVLTLNAWHGLRTGESKTRFPGEEPERKRARVTWQLEEIRRLEPDLVLLQEMNPNPPEARKYAETLGYDEIHKVTSCGIHLPPIKIPKNVNEGLAILARPELALKRAGKTKLSGDAACTATYGFQTRESRYVLIGRIRVAGRELLVATTHLSAPPDVGPDFETNLARLAARGRIEETERDEILATLLHKRQRNRIEAERLIVRIERQRQEGRRQSGTPTPVILGGDFNVESDSPAFELIESAGLRSAAVGPAFATWDPSRNRVNHSIGARRSPGLPTFDRPAIEALFEALEPRTRQIDHLFASDEFRVVEARLVMTEGRNGILPSDHFGILVVLEL